MKTNNYFCIAGTVINVSTGQYREDGIYTYMIVLMLNVDDNGNPIERKYNNIPIHLFDKLAEKHEEFLHLNAKVLIEGHIESIYEDAISGNEYILTESAQENEETIFEFKGFRLVVTAITIL